MTFDRKDFLESLGDKKKATNDILPLLRASQAVAPVMESLLTDTHWDRYLQFLQYYINQYEEAKITAQTKLNSNYTAISYEEMIKLKMDIIQADSFIDAWKIAMGLPKALIIGAENALIIYDPTTKTQ